jgi:hypothetical protein
MSLVIAWVAFPVVLCLVVVGLGMLVDRVAGGRVAGVLIVPLGLAALVALSQLTTSWSFTAPATTPVILLAAAGGYVAGMARLRRARVDRWALAAALGVFATLAAPVVLSGEATFAGYTLLGDTAIHFVGADRLLGHGRDFAGLPASAYKNMLISYFGTGYPAGGPTAIGAVRPLVAQDVAWIYQPFLAFMVASMGLALYALAGRVVAAASARALVAFVAAQPAILYAYAMQGSIKELGVAWAAVLLGALFVDFVHEPRASWPGAIPMAVASAAGIGVVGLVASLWIGPIGAASLAVLLWANRGRRARWLVLAESAVFAGLVALLSYQSLAVGKTYVKVVGAVVKAPKEYGNLLGPLDPLQIFGVWLTGDYRGPPTGASLSVTYILLGGVMAAAALGLLWLVRQRRWSVLAFVAVSLFAWWYTTRAGSPWARGKALAVVSPVVMFVAMLGPLSLLAGRGRLVGLSLAGAVALGVLWSNALTYHSVSLAPRDRLAELSRLDDRLVGQGPTLITDFEPFAVHFLRKTAPDNVAARAGFGSELDQRAVGKVLRYRTIILRRGANQSRPPAVYRRVLTGRYYDVWQRPLASQREVLAHLPLGRGLQVSSSPRCASVKSLAAVAATNAAQLAYAARAPALAIQPSRTPFPPGWAIDTPQSADLHTRGRGRIRAAVTALVGGDYQLSVDGTIGRALTLYVDGRRAGSVAYELNGRGSDNLVATVRLTRGRHVITLLRGSGDARPGSGDDQLRLLGPIRLTLRDPTAEPVRYLAPQAWRTLCGRTLDWIEVVRPND